MGAALCKRRGSWLYNALVVASQISIPCWQELALRIVLTPIYSAEGASASSVCAIILSACAQSPRVPRLSKIFFVGIPFRRHRLSRTQLASQSRMCHLGLFHTTLFTSSDTVRHQLQYQTRSLHSVHLVHTCMCWYPVFGRAINT